MNIQLSKPISAMTALTEFTCFPKLPTELRMEIWKRVPQPERIVGWIPCGKCRDICRRKSRSREEQDGKPLARQRCMQTNHPNWLVKYVVHPRKDAIFAPLHVCREARELWRTQYYTPPRQIIVNELGIDIPVQFNVPFISYEHDIFTMFGAWSSTTIFDMESPMEAPIEPFIGLDRARIEHGGYSEILDLFFPASTLFEVNELPALRRLSLVTMGPQPQEDEDQEDGVLMQMHACVAENYDCQIIDLTSPEIGENSIILNECRPRRKPIHWYTKERQFDGYYNYWKAWLWHVVEAQAHFLIKSNTVSWWTIVNFALAENPAWNSSPSPEDCPLYPDQCSGPTGHRKCVIDNWKPKFDLSCKYLCEERWVKVLQGDLDVKIEGWKQPIDRAAKVREDGRIRDFINANYPNFWKWWQGDVE
ncbi:hypothetical protein GGI35DRAFT_36822 [Trichoderma velutinum]